MRRRKTALKGTQTKETGERPPRQCRHCIHSRDWYSPAVYRDEQGNQIMTLGRCPFGGQQGRYAILLSAPACEHFEERTKHQSNG